MKAVLLVALIATGCVHTAPKVTVPHDPAHYGLPVEARDDDLLCVDSAGVSISSFVCATIAEVRWYIRHARQADGRR